MARGPNLSGLQWTYKQLPYAAGLDQLSDDRARPQPFLDIANDIQFDELGGIQTRLPFVGQVSPTLPDGSIFGGGSLTDVRKLAVNGDELVLFTKDQLYSWNAKLSKWVQRGTHLAVAVDETSRFVTTGDQIDADRAELNGTIVFAWTEGTQVFAAALDKTTGSVLVSPTAVSTAIGRPRLVALSTKILLFVEASTTLLTVRAIDPAAPGTAIGGAGTTVLATDFNLFYDVVRAGTQDLCIGACRRQTTTSYTVFKVSPALAVTTSTKARTCDGPIAVATVADGTQTQIVRANNTNIEGDLLTTSTLADVFIAQAIGSVPVTPVNQIAIEFAGTTARAFWSATESTDPALDPVRANTVTTANTIGAQSVFELAIGIASRAFQFDGYIYIWLVFGAASEAITALPSSGVRAQLQNTYFLYRDDGLLISRATFDVAGGFAKATGHLPGVALTNGSTTFSWAGTARRVIDLGTSDQTGYDSRSPRDIVFTFDSNEARRYVRLGGTLYISGGLPMQYDGVHLVELGFQIYPFFLIGSSGGAGAIAAGAYQYKSTLRWVGAQGEQERSTTAIGIQVTATANTKIQLGTVPLHITRRTAAHGSPAIEWWRTEVNPGDDSLFYLVTSKDPALLTGDNDFITNDATAAQSATLSDNFTDAILTTKEQNPENGAVLESLAPPGAGIIIATDTRLFLGDVVGDPDRVWYSRLRNAGEIASFHDALTIDVPPIGGRITGLGFQDETLFVWRETALYALPGVGFDNLGQGQNFGNPARTVSLDVGAVSQESIALTPKGTIFKANKGWHLLGGDGELTYIGDKVADFDNELVLAVNVVDKQHQVRISTSARMLVWDYSVGQWAAWTVETVNGTLVDSVIYQGEQVILITQGSSTQGTMTQATTYSGLNYGIDVETAWIKPDDVQQGAISARRLQPLGESRSACLVRSRIAYNYKQDASGNAIYVDDKVYDPVADGLAAGDPLQFVHSPKRPQCDAFKLRLTAVAPFRGNVSAIFGTDDSFGGDGFDQLVAVIGSAGAVWEASLIADLRAEEDGELGNRLTMTIAFEDGAPFAIDAREDFTWDGTEWVPQVDNLGVRVICRAGSSPTVAQLESAIALASTRFELDSTHPDPASVIDAAAMAGVFTQGQFFGGAFNPPSGEAIKLTSLGMELGTEPGLFRRLNAAKKI